MARISDVVLVASLIQTIIFMIPVITVVPAVLTFKRSITHSMLQSEVVHRATILYSDESDLIRLNSAIVDTVINHAIRFGKIMLISVSIFPFFFGIIQFYAVSIAVKVSTQIGVFYFFYALQFWSIIISTAVIVGILSFLIMDQRYSYYLLLDMRHKALANEVTDHVYLTVGRRLEERDAQTALNLIVAVALVIVALCAIFLILSNTHQSLSVGNHIYGSLAFVFFVGKEIVILLVIM